MIRPPSMKRKLKGWNVNALCCPECGAKTCVVDTRASGTNLRRRRKCLKCAHRMTTLEIAATDKATDATIINGGTRPALYDSVRSKIVRDVADSLLRVAKVMKKTGRFD